MPADFRSERVDSKSWSRGFGAAAVRKDDFSEASDSGLLHALLGMSDRQALRGHPKFDANREGFALEQVLASLPAGDAWFLGCF